MPELPEIEIVKRSLIKKINKAKIIDIIINNKNLRYRVSNTFSRENFRHNSFITPVAKGLIVGFGLDSYRLGIETVLKK